LRVRHPWSQLDLRSLSGSGAGCYAKQQSSGWSQPGRLVRF
jgi:hypothetical protein